MNSPAQYGLALAPDYDPVVLETLRGWLAKVTTKAAQPSASRIPSACTPGAGTARRRRMGSWKTGSSSSTPGTTPPTIRPEGSTATAGSPA